MIIYFVGANILFDSGVIAFDENCCCGYPCDPCLHGILPNLIVTLSDWSRRIIQPGDCGCEEVNGDYAVPATLPDGCESQATFVVDVPCNGVLDWNKLVITVRMEKIGSNYILSVVVSSFRNDDARGQATFAYDFGESKPDCTTWSSLQLAIVLGNMSGCAMINFPSDTRADGLLFVTSA